MAGDYTYEKVANLYPWAADANSVAATDWSGSNVLQLVAAKASHTIYVQRIVVSVTVDNAATWLFEDNASTPVQIAKTKASPGLGVLAWDFGPKGVPLTEGKNFQVISSGAGLGGQVHAEGYFLQTSNLTGQNTAQPNRWKTDN